MSRQSERIFEALSDVGPEKVQDAAPGRRRIPWKRFGTLAAVLALVLTAGGLVLPRLGRDGAAGGGDNGSGAPAGGEGPGSDGASTFMSYAGPVFPLTLAPGEEALSAEREITLDFAPWGKTWQSNEEEAAGREDLTEEQRQEVLSDYSAWYPEGGRSLSSTDILVRDAYTLANDSPEDRTVTVLYPFAASLRDMAKRRPVLTLEDRPLEAELHAGGYSGGFQGAWANWPEEPDNPGSLNLRQPSGWEDYRDRLEDGTYLQSALEDWPDLSGIPVTVYEFTESWGTEADGGAGIPNPSIQARFSLDYDRTTVLSHGFNGASFDREGGTMIQEFSIPRPGSSRSGDPCWLIVLGEDIRDLTTGGYVTGGADADTPELPESGVQVERYESDLETMLRKVTRLRLRRDEALEGVDPELYLGLMKDNLLSSGPLAESPAERYDTGWLEELDFAAMDRVFYLEAELTVPAGGTVTLTAEMVKEASFDFFCAQTENQYVCGYDLVTSLGTSLTLTRQTAVLEDRGQIEILRQNFGFDLAAGVREAELDPEIPHYYLEVRRVPEDHT